MPGDPPTGVPAAPMNSAQFNLRGILAMTLSSLLFVVSDLLLKLTAQTIPTGEIIFIRSVFLWMPVLVVLAATGQLGGLKRLNRRAWVRTAADLIATMSYLPALFHMPLGNTVVIRQVGPLALVACAAIFLGETVGWRRWTAIAVGFLGVVIVARPGLEGFNAYSLLLLVAVAGGTVRDILTRTLPIGVTSPALIIAMGLAGMPAGAAIGLFEQWVWPGPQALVNIAASSMVLIAGYHTVIFAIRVGDFSVTSTFRYTIIPFAILAGYLAWGDVPDTLTLVGTAIILGAGVYTVHRERRRSREIRKPVPGAAPP